MQSAGVKPEKQFTSKEFKKARMALVIKNNKKKL
jgi:hypothetical protein